MLQSEGILFQSIAWKKILHSGNLKNSEVEGDYQINQNFESLRFILLFFESEEYLSHNYCRKHFRLSRNITSL
mgnify:FL=1